MPAQNTYKMKAILLSILVLFNINLYAQTLEPKFDCESGTLSAISDLKNGLLKLIEYGFQPDNNTNTFSSILKRNYGILVEYPGCRAFPNYDCYNKVMLKEIEDKFGTEFLDSIRDRAYLLDSLGLGNRPPMFAKDDYYDKKLNSFLYFNLDFSKIDYDTANHSKVKVKFLVEKDGQLSDFQITDSASNKYNIEALRVAKMMPKWLYATRDGIPIEAYGFIEIIFSAGEKKRHSP
jgi:hypothetical protein